MSDNIYDDMFSNKFNTPRKQLTRKRKLPDYRNYPDAIFWLTVLISVALLVPLCLCNTPQYGYEHDTFWIGYYTFLRLDVCAYSLFIFFSREKKNGVCFGSVSVIVIALLYNPVFKVHFGKETWDIVNILTIIVFALIESGYAKEKYEERKKYRSMYKSFWHRAMVLPDSCVKCGKAINITSGKKLLCQSCYQEVQEYEKKENEDFYKPGYISFKINFRCKRCGNSERTAVPTFGYCKDCYYSLCDLESTARKNLVWYEFYKHEIRMPDDEEYLREIEIDERNKELKNKLEKQFEQQGEEFNLFTSKLSILFFAILLGVAIFLIYGFSSMK